MRHHYKTMRSNVRAAKNRRRGDVASGLSYNKTQGGKFAKKNYYIE